MRLPRRVLVPALFLLAAAVPALAGGGPAETVVLVNSDSADSKRVAEHYVRARQIPPAQVLELKCTASLETSMADFVRDVADPLRAFLRERGLEDRVRFVVMTQGMPIRARTGSGDVSTAAALALLHTPLCGANQPGVQPPLRSPAYKGGLPIPPNVPADRYLHVTALLSTTADEAISLVDRSVLSDGAAPAGALFVFQDANGNAATRNAYYDAARKQLETLGATTSHVPAGADKAVNLKRIMGYMAGGAYSSLTAEGVKTNEYLPGAICDHLQSYGAVPQNFGADPKQHSQFPVTHMVRAGITGVHGAVSEPFTIAFPDPDLFTAYVQGATLAETFDVRNPIAYWMNLVLGDALCAPYAARPKVEVSGTPAGSWSGTAKLTAKAAGAKRIAAYVDGVEVASADADTLEGVVDTTRFPDGARHVLVQATGAGEWEPRGWTVIPATFANPGAHVASRPAKFAGALRVALTRAPAGGEKPAVTLTAGGAAVPGTSKVDGAELVFDPQGALPAGPLVVTVSGLGESVQWTATAAASSVETDAKATATAGDEATLRAVVKRADGSPAAGWRGRVDVRQADPPVLFSSKDVEVGADGAFEIPARFTKAGAVALRVSLPDDRVETTAKLTIAAGPPHHATSPLNRVPLGQPCDVDVVVEDAFGNRTDGFEGELRLEVPTDPDVTVPPAVRIAKEDRGRAVFRDVVFTRGGQQALVILDGAGKRWSQPSEGVEAQHAPLRGWLVSTAIRGDDAAKAFAADPTGAADRDGCVAGGRLFRRLRARGDDVSLPSPGAKDGDAVAATAFLRATSATKARLVGAAPARIAVFLDGKLVFDGVPKATDPKGKREPLADLALAEGPHRLTVVALRANRAATFSLELDDGAGKHADGVTAAAAATDAAPATFTASGRVRRGGGGAAGAKVTLKGADGADRTVAVGPDGTWFVEGLPAGEIEVRAEWQHPLAPARRTATIDGGNVVDLDFVAEDKTPPTVKLDLAPPRFGRSVVLDPTVDDDDGVREVRLLLDGTEIAKATAAPWHLQAEVAAKARGKHELVVVAVDPSGNEGRSAPLAVTLIDDAKGPALKLSGLANNADLKKKTAVTATVTDDLPVVSVRFRVDGKDVAGTRTSPTAPTWTADVDPKGLADGVHALSVSAKDLDGNETLVEVKFKTK